MFSEEDEEENELKMKKPHECKTCGRRLATLSALIQHMRTHSREKQVSSIIIRVIFIIIQVTSIALKIIAIKI